MEAQALSEIIDAVVFESGIDGQVSATGRYTTARLTALFNRTWTSLRSLVSGAGHRYFLDETSAAVIPGAIAPEDYIVVPYPTVASTQAPVEVHGVDVLGSDGWDTLDPVDFALRRVVGGRGAPNALECNPGSWAVKKLPTENGTGVTAGEIALFPQFLAGSYKIMYLKPWIPIASGSQSNVVIGYPDWFTWAIATMVMTIVGQRDNNKKGTYGTSEAKMLRAEARIKEQARRVQRAGPVVVRRKDGWDNLI
jgi:hypothetical protein